MNNFDDKTALKQQAKSMLLKGCYKMASNKYKRLIEMGSDGFSARDWAIIHLNTGISLQFQQKLEEALDYVSKSIQIDNSYQKAYYRRLQILEEQGNYEAALADNIVPYFIKNKEIDQLKVDNFNKIKTRMQQQYQRELGLGDLQKKIQSQEFISRIGQKNIGMFLKQTYKRIFNRISENLINSQTDVNNLAQEIGAHYSFIKQKNPEGVQQFCHQMRRLLINQKDSTKLSKIITKFWAAYRQNRTTTNKKDIQNEISQQDMLLSFFPCIVDTPSLFIKLINQFVRNGLIKNEQHLKILLQFLHTNFLALKNIDHQQNHQYLIDNIYNILLYCGQKLVEFIDCLNFKQYEEYTLLVQSLSQILKFLTPNSDSLFDYSSISLAYLSKSISHSKYDSLQSVQKHMNILLGLLIQNENSFSCLVLIQQQISSMKMEYTIKTGQVLIDTVVDILEMLFKKDGTRVVKQVLSVIVMYSIYAQISGFKLHKIMNHAQQQESSLKQQNQINILQQIQQYLINVPQIIKSLHFQDLHPASIFHFAQFYIKSLNFITIVSPQTLLALITHSSSLLKVFTQLLASFLVKHNNIFCLRALTEILKLIYGFIVDIQNQQESLFAEKMGVNLQEVKKARKLQGEKIDEQITEKIMKGRDVFVREHFFKEDGEKGWVGVLCQILEYVMKTQGISKSEEEVTPMTRFRRMGVQIVEKLSQKMQKKCYQPAFIFFMTKSFKKEASEGSEAHKTNLYISQYFSNVCKKCNPQIFQYSQFQPITNILLFGLQNANHELLIFQSLLSLVQLSSNKIDVPLSIPINLLIEQNQYIVHASFQLINNLLINISNPQKEIKNFKRIIDILLKYYGYYRQLVIGKQYQEENLSDYSHPCKVFNTLIAISMVIQEISENMQCDEQFKKIKFEIESEVKELVNEKEAEIALKSLKGDFSLLIFKLGVHFGKKSGKLPKILIQNHPQQVEMLRITDQEKWQKLQYYINH